MLGSLELGYWTYDAACEDRSISFGEVRGSIPLKLSYMLLGRHFTEASWLLSFSVLSSETPLTLHDRVLSL